mmetsp:Transcript_46753/g.92313  ORF Transcript_46753/g.92313 Transcript_46753/m.92313 type:complete len:408 (-) Transcript_46753:124-1347(-)
MDAPPAEGGRDSRESLQLAEDVLSALAFLHEKGKVHCDVKPENIFVTERGRAVLGDFDGVKERNHQQSTILHVTTQYLAPEIRGRVHMTSAADVFSAGLVLSELLGGGVLEGEPQRTAAFQELSESMRSPDPSGRPTAAAALQSPLFSREKNENAQCIVCFDVFLCDRGLKCSERASHFLCAECLNRHVEANAVIDPENSEVRARFKAANCEVACVQQGCPSAPFPHARLAQLLQPEVHKSLEKTRGEVAEERVRTEMEKEYREKLQRALREDGAQRKVREIGEDILNLKCPRCSQVFLDYEGCAALKCSRCHCAFCAYCLRDCGRDAHGHVPDCTVAIEIGNRVDFRFGMFPDPPDSTHRSQWNLFLKERQKDRVREAVSGLGDEDRSEVMRQLQPLLKERGIQLE